MKIVYYLPSLYMSGGLERIITLKANYFADHFGYEITILTSEQEGKDPYYKLSPNVKHVDLGVAFDKQGQKQSFIAKAVKYPFRYYAFKQKFSRFLNAYKPDITISTLRRELNFINRLQDGSAKMGEFHVTRYAYHANAMQGGNPIKQLIKKRWEQSFLNNLSQLDKLVLLTEEERGNWKELTNTMVINNPLPFRSEKQSACTEKQVIAVGRYAYQKGFDMLIDAWKIVSDRHPDWTLSIYGEGHRDELQAQIDKLGLSDTCLLKQPVNNIIDKYLESSIFVLSSRFEGFGMVIVEAMACGVPTVSFDCACGPKDIIKDSQDGLLVTSGNIEQLADKICYLIAHHAIRKEMGKQAFENSKRFSIENIASQWKNLFESLVESKKRTS